MKNFFKNIWKYLIPFIIGFIIGILINIPSCQKVPSIPKIQYVEKHDTLTIEKERIVQHTKPVLITDTIVKVDSIYIEKDGTYVELPVTWNQYRDTIKTDSTEAYIEIDHHGVISEIDRVYLDYKYNKEIQTIIKEPKKIGIVWSVGPCVGFGGVGNLSNGSIGYGPFVGVSGSIGIGGFIK